jgi:hypothetical protein
VRHSSARRRARPHDAGRRSAPPAGVREASGCSADYSILLQWDYGSGGRRIRNLLAACCIHMQSPYEDESFNPSTWMGRRPTPTRRHRRRRPLPAGAPHHTPLSSGRRSAASVGGRRTWYVGRCLPGTTTSRPQINQAAVPKRPPQGPNSTPLSRRQRACPWLEEDGSEQRGARVGGASPRVSLRGASPRATRADHAVAGVQGLRLQCGESAQQGPSPALLFGPPHCKGRTLVPTSRCPRAPVGAHSGQRARRGACQGFPGAVACRRRGREAETGRCLHGWTGARAETTRRRACQ